jgi:hypothetical protein
MGPLLSQSFTDYIFSNAECMQAADAWLERQLENANRGSQEWSTTFTGERVVKAPIYNIGHSSKNEY